MTPCSGGFGFSAARAEPCAPGCLSCSSGFLGRRHAQATQTQAQAPAQDQQGPPTIVVFGDSQAAGLARGLQRVLAEDPRFRVLNRTHAGAVAGA